MYVSIQTSPTRFIECIKKGFSRAGRQEIGPDEHLHGLGNFLTGKLLKFFFSFLPFSSFDGPGPGQPPLSP